MYFGPFSGVKSLGIDRYIAVHSNDPAAAARYAVDCRACVLKPNCCPNMPSRRIVRDVNQDARDIARVLAKTEAFERSRRHRKSVEMLFAHLKRILQLGRLRLRGPCGAQDEFTLAAIAQNLRRLAKLVARPPPGADACLAYQMRGVSAL
jgi:Transposase DDE domain